jgi:hypothetical protein
LNERHGSDERGVDRGWERVGTTHGLGWISQCYSENSGLCFRKNSAPSPSAHLQPRLIRGGRGGAENPAGAAGVGF